MNYTEKYHLPQWEETDRIMHTDFNSAMASLDSGIAEAKTAADNAQAAAVEAAKLPYVIGSYTGTGESITIHLGFRPSFLIIASMEECFSATGTDTYDRYNAITSGTTLTRMLTFHNDGFTANPSSRNNGESPRLTFPNRLYNYIAFR